MAIGALDRLITTIELRDKFSDKADDIKKSADEVADSLGEDAEQLKKYQKELDDLSGKLANPIGGLKKVFGSAFTNALATGMMASSRAMGVFTGVMGTAARAGTSLGGSLASVVTALTGPIGLVVGAGLAVIAIGAMATATGYAVGFMSAALSSLIPLVNTLASAFTTVLGPAMLLPFVKAYADVEKMEMLYGAFLGSPEKGKQMVEFGRAYGQKSVLGQNEVREIIRTLIMAKQDVNEHLPTAEAFALGGGPNTTLNAQVIANAIRYAAGGQLGFAIDNLGQIGIGRAQLIEHGAEFNNQGQFLGEFKDFMDVIKRLANTKEFKAARSSLEESAATRLSSAVDSFQIAFEEAGRAFAGYVLPVVEKATQWLTNIANSGWFDKIAKNFNKLFNPGGDGLIKVVAGVMTMIELLPQMLQAASYILVETLSFAGKHIMGIIRTAIGVISPALVAAMDLAMAKGASDFNRFKEAIIPSRRWNATYDKNLEILNKPAQSKNLVAPDVDPGTVPPTDPEAIRTNMILEDIRENTKKLVDVRRLMFGGGELGRLGVTAADVSMSRNPRRPSGGGDMFDQMADMMREAVGSTMQAGFRGRGRAYS